MRKHGVRFCALVVVVPLVLGACSSGGDSGDNGDNEGDGSATQQTVSVSEYANSVCTALKTWLADIQKGASDLATGISAGASPDQGKVVIRDYLDSVIDDTQKFIDSVQSAGSPDVQGGSEAATALVDAFERIETALEKARDAVDELPTDSPQAFATAAAQLAQTIQTNLASATNTLSNVPAPDLENAFASAPACTSAVSPPGS